MSVCVFSFMPLLGTRLPCRLGPLSLCVAGHGCHFADNIVGPDAGLWRRSERADDVAVPAHARRGGEAPLGRTPEGSRGDLLFFLGLSPVWVPGVFLSVVCCVGVCG